uniref:Uncharacterized protein n=1 Tax=Parastrongyloides trichosuri TaxID=131310 RepID=A0A0N4Z669_PARTI
MFQFIYNQFIISFVLTSCSKKREGKKSNDNSESGRNGNDDVRTDVGGNGNNKSAKEGRKNGCSSVKRKKRDSGTHKRPERSSHKGNNGSKYKKVQSNKEIMKKKDVGNDHSIKQDVQICVPIVTVKEKIVVKESENKNVNNKNITERRKKISSAHVKVKKDRSKKQPAKIIDDDSIRVMNFDVNLLDATQHTVTVTPSKNGKIKKNKSKDLEVENVVEKKEDDEEMIEKHLFQGTKEVEDDNTPYERLDNIQSMAK